MINNTRFLVFRDYSMQIQSEDLFQILGEKRIPDEACDCISLQSRTILLDAEATAIEEMSSYLRGRYIVDEIFAPTQCYASGTTYFGNNLIDYFEPAFDSGTTYNQGDRVSYCGRIYQVIASGTTTGAQPSLTSTTYSYIALNHSFYYATLPCAAFNPNVTYQTGNLVWYQDNIYQAKNTVFGTTPAQSQNLELRYGIPSAQSYLGYYFNTTGELMSNPLPNVNTNYWSLYNGPVSNWFTGTTYYFSGIRPAEYVPVWDSSTTYSAGQYVTYNNISYIALAGNTGTAPLTNPTGVTFITVETQTPNIIRPQQNTITIGPNIIAGVSYNIYVGSTTVSYVAQPGDDANAISFGLAIQYNLQQGTSTDSYFLSTNINDDGGSVRVVWNFNNVAFTSTSDVTIPAIWLAQINPATYYWTLGDNRNPQIRLRLIDILLYHLHSRINPRNVPELRNIRYDGNNSFQSGGAIGWLKMIQQGKVNLNCQEIIPVQGGNIRFGSYPKNSNYGF